MSDGEPLLKYCSIEELTPDADNANDHTEFGMGLLEDAIRTDGLGRSILLDEDLNIIAGNGVVESAGNAGITRVRLIETDGNEIVGVVRKGVKLESARGRRMALGDNLIAHRNLHLNPDVIARQAAQHAINISSIGLTDEQLQQMQIEAARREAHSEMAAPDQMVDAPPPPEPRPRDERITVTVVCPDSQTQEGVLEDLVQRYGSIEGFSIRRSKPR